MLQKSTTAPLFIYGTRHGTLYNLTPSNIPKTIKAVQINYGDFHDYLETIENLPEGINFKKFMSYPQETLTYLAPYDFSKPDCMTGCHYNNKVKIRCNKGYTEITAPLFDRMVELIKPDFFVGLTEYPSLLKNHAQTNDSEKQQGKNKNNNEKNKNGKEKGEENKDKNEKNKMEEEKLENNEEEAQKVENKDKVAVEDEKDLGQQSNKSNKRAICKTKSYLELSKYTNNQETDQYPKEGPVRLATVHGGTNLSLINRSLEQVLDHAIDGIVLCDLCEGETLQQREEVYTTINKRLEQEYQRDNSYFKNKKLQLVLAGLGKLEDIQHALNFGFSIFEVNLPFQLAEKHLALTFNTESGKYESRQPVKRPELLPLEAGCQCYSCTNHNEAYIAHLIECFELTAKVLLSIHNLHVYENWLQVYRAKMNE